jgi:hypothetical protein
MPFFARRHVVAGFFCALLAATPSVAVAQKKGATAEAKQREARDHYQKGVTHYNLGEFVQAIEEFKQAYAISQAHGLLFNIAQAYRLTQDHRQALYFYKTYLRLVPEAPNRADVESRMVEIEKLLAEQERLKNDKPVGTIPPGATTPEAAAPAPAPTSTPPATPVAPSTEAATTAAEASPSPAPASAAREAGIAKALPPSAARGSTSAFVRSDIDGKGAGLAVLVGVSHALNRRTDLFVAGMFGGLFGAEVGATLTFSDGRLRPLAFAGIPLFISEGVIVGGHVGAGVEYQLHRQLGVFAHLGAAYFPSAREHAKLAILPGIGISARL